MLRLLRLLVPLSATVIVAACAAPALADDVVADDLSRDTPIAARSGVVAWSRFDSASQTYRLVLQDGSSRVQPPIADSRKPFDVSMGTDRRGRLVALYSRCRTGTDRGCDVYRYDVASATEQKVTSVSGPSEDEAWPAQSGDLLVFARRRPHGNPKGELHDCDLIYVKDLASRAPSRRLDRGSCAQTEGISLRGTRIVQVTLGSPPHERFSSQVRLLSTRGGPVKVLAQQSFGEESNIYSSPSQSNASVWLVHDGIHASPKFVRIDLASRRIAEVPARVGLTGSFARDEQGTSWYVQSPEGSDGDCIDAASAPCRLIRTATSPFSSTERSLAPSLTIGAPSDSGLPVFGDPFALSGKLVRAVISRGAVVRSDAIAGATVRLLRRVTDPAQPGLHESLEPTALTATTGADGGWSIPLAAPPAEPWFSAVTEGQPSRTFAGRGTVGTVDARMTLGVAGDSFSGAVLPAQPGRTVKIQRRVKHTCQKTVSGQSICNDVWATVADAPLDAAGTGFAATVVSPAPGIYTAALPFADQRADPEAYGGRSPETTIG